MYSHIAFSEVLEVMTMCLIFAMTVSEKNLVEEELCKEGRRLNKQKYQQFE